MNRPPLNYRLSWVALGVVSTIAVLQIGAVRLASGTFPPWWLTVPLLGAPLFVLVYTPFVIRSKVSPLERAVRQIARGDLGARVQRAPDREFVPLEESFNTMAATIERLTLTLREADAQRRRLFSNLAHELATPTSTLLGIAEAMQDPAIADDPDRRATLLETLNVESTRLERLVRDVRDLADVDDPDVSIERTACDFAAVVSGTARHLGSLHARAIDVDVEACEALVDPVRMDQLVSNLLRNALRYTPEGAAIRLTLQKKATTAILRVEDGGPGVPAEALEHLGERLFRVDPSRSRQTGGSGLGLSIVSAIARRHGGTLTFERSPLGGLAAVVAIPLC